MPRDGSLCTGELSALPRAAATSGKAPSREGFLWLPAGDRLQLEQTIRRKIGSINQLSKIVNICFAHRLICTNLLPLQKEPFLPSAPEGPLNPFLTVGRRCRSELQAAAFISAPWPGFQSARPAGGAGPRQALEARWNSVWAGRRKLLLWTWGFSFPGNAGGSQAHGAVPGGLEFCFLRGLVCRQPLTFFSPSWTVHDRELRLNFRVACIAGLYKIILSEHTSKIAFINILYLLMKRFLF